MDKFGESMMRLNRMLALSLFPDSVDGIYFRAMQDVEEHSERVLKRIDEILFSEDYHV
jgi:hypothetical protein